MNLNVTLFGQLITFAILVWFTMKYVWPPLTKALTERQNKIADGLAAAERGIHELELAQHKAAEQLRDAKIHAAGILEKANQRATQILEEAKHQARLEGEHLIQLAKEEIAQQFMQAKLQLRQQVAEIAIASAEKILARRLDQAANAELVDELLANI